MNRLLIGLLALYAVVFAVLEVVFTPVYIGAVPAPFGAVAAAVTNTGLTWAATQFARRTSIAAIPLAAWVVTVLVLASGGPGGDVLVPGDWKALLLFGLGVVPAGVLLGRHMGATAVRRAVSER